MERSAAFNGITPEQKGERPPKAAASAIIFRGDPQDGG